jgi:hypothetical protein
MYPCSHCTKSGNECVFPERKRMQRPRKSKNSELLNRISRLESIVGNVSLDNLKDADLAELKGLTNLKAQVADSEPRFQSQSPASTEAAGSTRPPQPTPSSESQEPQMKIHLSKYISSDFWSKLATEVEGLKYALAESGDSDSEEEYDAESPESHHVHKRQTFATQGLLAGYPSPESAGLLTHPPEYQIKFLVATFFERVDAVLKVLHRPTILKMAAEGTSKLNPAQEALMFSVYFAAITSLPPSMCISQLNQDQPTLIKIYQLNIERALAAADYLNNNDLESLQAVLLYVACLRVHNDTRASWVLTAMLLRLAQAFGINRDGNGSRYSPYVAEIRRRLWWQILVLDIRAAEDRGTEAMIDFETFNTRLPMNINDEDFGPDSVGPLTEKTGPTEVTFLLCTAQSSSIFVWFAHAQSRFTSSPPKDLEGEVIAKTRALEKEFIGMHHTSHTGSMLAASLARLVTLKSWLMLYYPIHRQGQIASSADSTVPRRPRPSREAILQTALNIIELQVHKNDASNGWGGYFAWWGATYVQWHPLAVALVELCAQTDGLLVARAWRAVDVVYREWAKYVADSRHGALWRPIRKLYRKAREARAAAVRREAAQAHARTAGALETLSLLGVDADAADDVMADFASGDSSGAVLAAAVAAGAVGSGGAEALAGMQGPATAAAGPAPGSFECGNTMYFDPSASSMAATVMGGDGSAEQQQSQPFNTQGSMLAPMDFFVDKGTTRWPDVNFDAILENPNDQVNWTIWNEFLDDTYADRGSRTGSSSDGLS